MKMSGNNRVRALWLLSLSFFFAAVLPNALGRPYPKPIRSYMEWGGLLLFLLSAFLILAFARRLRDPASK
jgi:hypothetical protein